MGIGIIDWLKRTHNNDLARKALERVRNGYPLPGDVTRISRHYEDVGSILADDPAVAQREKAAFAAELKKNGGKRNGKGRR
jgi:hypothetical protein